VSPLDATLLCFYCQLSIDPVSDCWIGHGTMAHYRCAWAADEAFFFSYDQARNDTEGISERP
jgi:hypothetical protein